MENMVDESIEHRKHLSSEIKTMCGKVAKLETLSEVDRKGKYRKAIEELFTTLNGKVKEYLILMAFGRFWIQQSGIDTLHHNWYESEEFMYQVRSAWRAAKVGDYEKLISTATEMRRQCTMLIESVGGREYKEENE